VVSSGILGGVPRKKLYVAFARAKRFGVRPNAMFMQLVEAGKVSLDAPVRTYVTDFKLADPRGGAITMRQLLAHRSGLSDKVFHEKSGPLPASLSEGVTMLGNARLGAEPGEKVQYHNPNYWLAARLVEVVSGESFPDYLERRVFAPLGMRNTKAIDRLDSRSGVAKGHVRIFTRPVALREPDWFLGGASGIVTTANDMARWLAMQNNAGKTSDGTQIVSAASIDSMHEGLGWQPHERGGTKIIDHSGWMFTFTAHQVLIPSCRCGIAVMSNVGLGLAPVDSEVVADMITDLVEGRTMDPPPPIGFRVDAVLMVVTAVVLVCGVRALWHSSAWAAASARRRRWRAVTNRVLWLSPLALLLALPSILRFIFAGRDASYTQMIYVVPSLVMCLAAASAMGLLVVILRSRRQVVNRESAGTEAGARP